jgi:hypothetical protein
MKGNPGTQEVQEFRGFSVTTSEDLYELLSERHRRSSTIVLSNRPPDNWYELFANPVRAESVPSRSNGGQQLPSREAPDLDGPAKGRGTKTAG